MEFWNDEIHSTLEHSCMRFPSSLIDWWLLEASSTNHYCQVVMPWLRKFHVRLCRHGIWYSLKVGMVFGITFILYGYTKYHADRRKRFKAIDHEHEEPIQSWILALSTGEYESDKQ
jgi:hypothetical protein